MDVTSRLALWSERCCTLGHDARFRGWVAQVFRTVLPYCSLLR